MPLGLAMHPDLMGATSYKFHLNKAEQLALVEQIDPAQCVFSSGVDAHASLPVCKMYFAQRVAYFGKFSRPAAFDRCVILFANRFILQNQLHSQ
jgi:hypothetical protein